MKPSAAKRGFLAFLACLAALAVVGAGSIAYTRANLTYLQDTARRGDNTLQLAATSLRGQMARFERLPQLIADHALIKAMARSPENPEIAVLVNAYLRDTQRLLGASDIYFMDEKGITRAASNFDQPTSFIGGDFSFRPYFFEAIRGGEGRYFALGTTSGKRGYYFGAPVRTTEAIRGVLVVKIDLDAIEQTWRGGDYELLVEGPDGIIFLSSRAEWLFTALHPLTADQRAQLSASRRYSDAALADFPATQSGARVASYRTLKLAEVDGAAHTYLALQQPMPEAGWTIWVLADTGSANRQAITFAIVVMLGLGLVLMSVAIVLQRRARLRERLMLQQAAQSQLERRVEERTRELAEVNTQLEAEVAERRLAEQNLRQAQADLVQAGKLAALGQMSAALSHEFNQPLGAARTYADNAAVLLDRGRVDDARSNIARILSLIERMSSISKHLRSFARSPGLKLGAVPLPEVIDAAKEIAQLRLKAADVSLIVDLPETLPAVIAGPVRLQQVLVNLLTNAADAVESTEDRRIYLAAEPQAGGVRITVRDHGPGVPAGLAERIFDPFFSTKGVGKGLGLGLSISYNIIKDFGGNLSVEAAEGGGARFVIMLKAAQPGELVQAD